MTKAHGCEGFDRVAEGGDHVEVAEGHVIALAVSQVIRNFRTTWLSFNNSTSIQHMIETLAPTNVGLFCVIPIGTPPHGSSPRAWG